MADILRRLTEKQVPFLSMLALVGGAIVAGFYLGRAAEEQRTLSMLKRMKAAAEERREPPPGESA